MEKITDSSDIPESMHLRELLQIKEKEIETLREKILEFKMAMHLIAESSFDDESKEITYMREIACISLSGSTHET